MHPIAGWTRHRFHYAWVVIAVTFLIMLVTAGIRATPSVMMVPLERGFGWSRTSISTALAINLKRIVKLCTNSPDLAARGAVRAEVATKE